MALLALRQHVTLFELYGYLDRILNTFPIAKCVLCIKLYCFSNDSHCWQMALHKRVVNYLASVMR